MISDRSKAVLICWIICLISVLCLSCFHISSYCLVITCWERADLLALACGVKLCGCYFPIWYPGSGMVLDCIDSDLYPLSYFHTVRIVLHILAVLVQWPGHRLHTNLLDIDTQLLVQCP